jgi:dethiobiotin synthetase
VPKLAELAGEVRASWPRSAPDVGLVELVGGPRSPLAADGDGVDLTAALAPDLVLLVGDAALGTLNAIQLSADVFEPHAVHVHLNRYDAAEELHGLNRRWLEQHGAWPLSTTVDGLVTAVALDPPRFCARCGRKLRVQVAPTGHRAECRVHGVRGS